MADEQVTMSYSVDTADVKSAEKAVDGLRTATDKAEKSTRNIGRSALETGRVVQDFAQGGIGGIVNNLEGLARALGGGPGLAGVLTLVGVGFLLLKKPMGDFLASMTDGGREIPKSTDAVKRLAGAQYKLAKSA